MNRLSSPTRALALPLVLAMHVAAAQTTAPPVPAPPVVAPSVTAPPVSAPSPKRAASDDGTQDAAHGPVAAFAWLAGCWKGSVNQREFREMWMPLQGGMMIGAGQQVQGGRMQDYEFLRLEPRVDGVHFTQFSGDGKAISFRLASTATDGNDTIFTFANAHEGFPARLVYRRGQDGWLYETIEGKLDGADRKVIYPLRRIGCETGELIHR